MSCCFVDEVFWSPVESIHVSGLSILPSRLFVSVVSQCFLGFGVLCYLID